MRHLLQGLFLSLFLSLFSAPSLFALDIPKRPEGYVSDYAKLLSGSARARLEQALRDFEDRTGNQVLVAVFPRLEGNALEDYSIRLAEAWKPGQKGKDNGVILLVFKEDRKVRIEVGYGLEGVLTDALCKGIIENEMVPRFRAGDYDGGIERGVTAILSAAQGEYRSSPSSRQEGWSSFKPALFVGFFISQILPMAVLWVLFLAGVSGVVASVVTGKLIFSLYALFLGILPLVLRSFFPVVFANSSGLSGRGYYRGTGGGGFGGFGGGGFSGGGGGFGGGGASGSW
ncbi:MAG: TPM domain-containing protein [Candidatus Omnitrophica bacterium]|nr:TPM domain-containing protein [Candidatus Omnitrophota bacterium]